MRPLLLSESLLTHTSPLSSLPPLWEVIYQEAVRGHHLLFKRSDVERFDNEDCGTYWEDAELSDELEIIVLKLVGCADLQAMVKSIDALPDTQRKTLYAFYRRAIWMWRQYVKTRMN